jgi:segregation and condensation protein B
MRRNSSNSPAPPEGNSSQTANEREPSPLSLGRLREAFAAMLGGQGNQSLQTHDQDGECSELPAPCSLPRAPEISPRSVVEAMLFVGRPDNRPVSARELAAAMRGVSPFEVDAAVAELNTIYDADATPYRIEHSHAGYRLVLRDEFERMRDKFYGRVRDAKLSPAAIEVLSVVAYNQPVTSSKIDELRGAPSGGAISTLVRRRLLRLERSHDQGGAPTYRTTDRFLRLFGLEDLSVLPRSEELEKE